MFFLHLTKIITSMLAISDKAVVLKLVFATFVFCLDRPSLFQTYRMTKKKGAGSDEVNKSVERFQCNTM